MQQWILVGLPLVCAWPLLVALAWFVPRLRASAERFAPLAAAPAFVLAVLAYTSDASDEVVRMPLVFSGLSFVLDGTARLFFAFTSTLWLAAGVFARGYLAHDAERRRFWLFFVLTLTGNLVLTVAADVLTFYLGFVCMTFAAYGLVVHRGDREALRAGRVYVVLSVAGELCLLTALLGLGVAAGGAPRFGPELEAAWSVLADGGVGFDAHTIALLCIAGFGVKAGLAPLHGWLPLAHPVAPTPASALLSGAMIKAGVLGWLRFLPEGTALPEAATVLFIAGTAGAFYGVVVGLMQSDPKTILAYSTVSQVGYLAGGTSLVLASEDSAPLALTAVLLHALHHAFAKGALFLGVGVVDRANARARRWAFAGVAAAALVLCGAPWTSGALAKGALKSAVGAAPREFAAGAAPGLLVSTVFFLGTVATTLLMARFFVALSRREPAEDAGGFPWTMRVSWAVLIAAVVSGAAWMPGFVSSDASSYGSDFFGALAPLAAGVATAVLVWRVGSQLSHTSRSLPLVPAGDIVVPLERAIQALPALRQEALVERVRRGLEGTSAVRQLLEHVLRRAAREDLRGMWGPVLGASLVALTAALALALMLGA